MYFITISNGLLSPTHHERMGAAIWEFLWCIDRITAVDETGVGVVRGGAPTKLIEVASALGCSESSVSRNLQKLHSAGYVSLKYAPYGIIIHVPKAKKRFGLRVHPQGIHRFSKNAGPPCKSAEPHCISAGPNKTGVETKIKDNEASRVSVVDNPRFEALKSEITKLAQTFRCTK